ncbi:uncharacterized protein LOC134856260 isoform X2 [Symsagittifera roscoffensis]
MDSEIDSAFMQSSSASNKDENNQSDQDNKLPTTNEADNTTGFKLGLQERIEAIVGGGGGGAEGEDVPAGLKDLLVNFSLSVMRSRPRDLLEHAQNYFTELRDAAVNKKSAKALEKLNVRWILKLTVHLCSLQALQTKTKTISLIKTISYRRQMRQIIQQALNWDSKRGSRR